MQLLERQKHKKRNTENRQKNQKKKKNHNCIIFWCIYFVPYIILEYLYIYISLIASPNSVFKGPSGKKNSPWYKLHAILVLIEHVCTADRSQTD